MKPVRHIATLAALSLLSATTGAPAQKASSLPQDLQQQQPPAQQDAKPPVMTHYDPGQYTTESTKDIPQIDPGKIPSPGKHAGPSAAPQPPPAPTGPEVTGFQTPDHLLDDMQRGRLPGDQGRYEQSVRELFGDADAIRDLPGMDGSEVDPRGQLGGHKDSPLDQLGGSGTGLDDAGFMPTPTTPRTSPQNTRGGPDRAPLTPGGPRDAMSGAAYGGGGRPPIPRFPDEREGNNTWEATGDTYERTTSKDNDGYVVNRHFYETDSNTGQREYYLHTREVWDRNGNLRASFAWDGEGNPVGDQGGGDIDRTLDPYAGGGDAELTLWHARNLGRGLKDTGIQDPNRGPPPGGEDGAAGAPPGTDFDLGDDIVINPDPVEAGGAGGGSLPRAIDHRSQIEQDHTPGGYTPEDRGGR